MLIIAIFFLSITTATVFHDEDRDSFELPNHHADELDDYLASRSVHGRRLLGVLETIPTDKWTMPPPTSLSSTIGHAKLPPSPSPFPPPPSPPPFPFPPPEPPLSAVDKDVPKECSLFKGSGCKSFHSQIPSPVLPAPRGNRSCSPDHCNHVGVCNFELGICMCSAGWTGPDCSTPQSRPCTNRYRNRKDDPLKVVGHIDLVTKEDLNWTASGWLASRCAGHCDDAVGMCYCGRDSKHRRILAPPGSPLGTRPVQGGRPMVEPCKPKEDGKGGKADWGKHTIAQLYGPGGWCNADSKAQLVNVSDGECGCGLEGRYDMCEKQLPVFCLNQCSGRGKCNFGFCLCDQGWYGSDCSRKRAGAVVETLDFTSIDIKIRETIRINPSALLAAADGGADISSFGLKKAKRRRRPFIYVYEIPPFYTSTMEQYKLSPVACLHRKFHVGGDGDFVSDGYNIEQFLHETFLTSAHRTYDAEEADFFYVPVYVACMMWPVLGWADFPWFYAPTAFPRTMHAANMLLEVKRWIQSAYPYWNRTRGKDHIWLANHDEGACWFPTEISNSSIILTHWGRLDENPLSNTGWPPDNYSTPLQDSSGQITFPKLQETDWRLIYKGSDGKGHVCYDPTKDIVLPQFKPPQHFEKSPALGRAPLVRDIFCYFKGDVGKHREVHYSRGIRQKLFRLSHENKWREKHNILYGTGAEYPGDYGEQLSRSIFCLVLPGDGYSGRGEDAILHGCIPVIIMDNVHAVWEGVIDWSKFSIRIPEKSLEDVPRILKEVSQDKIERMQANIVKVWWRFAYMTNGLHRHRLPPLYLRNKNIRVRNETDLPRDHIFRRRERYNVRSDAFHTLLQALAGKIDLGQEKIS